MILRNRVYKRRWHNASRATAAVLHEQVGCGDPSALIAEDLFHASIIADYRRVL